MCFYLAFYLMLSWLTSFYKSLSPISLPSIFLFAQQSFGLLLLLDKCLDCYLLFFTKLPQIQIRTLCTVKISLYISSLTESFNI